ncbi:MAG: argininosuccinate synthase [Planctomycetes bacterium]|jgi:argininosuccinate synthase|nr:argininosuccinate synthase [Planctomycetota bacterium]
MTFPHARKIVLAYSGGLDTTVAIPWLMEKTGAEIVALLVDVGQPEDLSAAVARALAAGASKARRIDVRQEFATGYCLPALKANALYEGVYPLLSALSRPLIVEKLVEEARVEGADAVAHGCTGKGNDQVRFELSIAALAPDLKVLAPARHWGFTREDSLAYAKARGLGFFSAKKAPFSIDENLWGRAIECGALDDAWVEPPEEAFAVTAGLADVPATPDVLEIEFADGAPIALDGVPLGFPDLVSAVASRAGAQGVGRIDHVESRTVGIKSREIYECPAAIPLIAAHKALEAMVLTREEARFKAQVEAAWANLVYEGKWHTPLRVALDAFVAATQASVRGTVKLKLHAGAVAVAGRRSPLSLYDAGLANYGRGDPFDHAAADGFLKISAMEIATLARTRGAPAPLVEVHGHEAAHVAQPVA